MLHGGLALMDEQTINVLGYKQIYNREKYIKVSVLYCFHL